MLSASEIRDLGLPGIPRTKPGITAMARRERWPSEERTGIGGTRVVYELPERYLAGAEEEPRDRYTAAEIANMRLPGLPVTKSNVILRADKEGWDYEESTGLGGVRKLYKIPDEYRPVFSFVPLMPTVVAGSSKVDLKKLELAMRALAEWEAKRDVTISEERRPAVISILYDYLVKSEDERGNEAMEVVFRALG